MIINKENIKTYWAILKEASPRWEIIKYIARRSLGFRDRFDRDVYVNGLNCGRLMENCCIASSEFEKDLKKEFKVAGGTWIFDIGANIGKHTVEMCRQNVSCCVEAFEPNPSIFKLLQENITKEEALARQAACSDKAEQVKFYMDEFHPAKNSIVKQVGRKSIDVNCTTLDAVTRRNWDFPVSLIKIDVEGAEMKVLAGAVKTLKKWHPKILFEAWNDASKTEVLLFLKKLGYNCYRRIDLYNYAVEKRDGKGRG